MKCKLSIQEKLKDLRIEKGPSLQELSEQTRVRLQNKGISDEDHYMKTLEAATISEDNYFNNLPRRKSNAINTND